MVALSSPSDQLDGMADSTAHAFDGKIALVTGSTRGIGRASAVALARHGATVVLNHRRDTPRALAAVQEAREEVEALGAPALVVRADVSDPAEVEAMFDRVEEELGGLDILVSNAALTVAKRLLEMEPEDWSLVLDTNIRGAMLCARHAARLMRGRAGRIVNVSSLGSRIHFVGGYGGLGAAKAALETLTLELQVEMDDAEAGIVVNAVCPGVVDTDSFWFFERRGLIEFEYGDYLTSPEEVAELVLYLCGPQELIRGQTIIADRGMTLRLGPRVRGTGGGGARSE
jgi:enoyl-[acyl-carrier protein] reductase III